MPLTAWPPSGVAWPPAGWSYVEAWPYSALVAAVREWGWTQAAPTATENRNIFGPVRCDQGHTVTGRVLVTPRGARLPFAVCTGAEREALVLWPPFTLGAGTE